MTITTSFLGWFFYFLVRLDIASLCTKFDSSSLSRSLDMGWVESVIINWCEFLFSVHTFSLPYFPLLHFPPVRSTPAFSTPAFSAPLTDRQMCRCRDHRHLCPVVDCGCWPLRVMGLPVSSSEDMLMLMMTLKMQCVALHGAMRRRAAPYGDTQHRYLMQCNAYRNASSESASRATVRCLLVFFV